MYKKECLQQYKCKAGPTLKCLQHFQEIILVPVSKPRTETCIHSIRFNFKRRMDRIRIQLITNIDWMECTLCQVSPGITR